MVVSAVEQTGEVPSFADRLGERLVVPQPSGALLEFLHFRPELSSAPFFELAVKTRLKRLSNFRHAAYARATRLQRDAAHGNRLALVSAYAPGRRLADVMVLARRGKLQPKIAAVLSLTKQLMTGVALLHDYAPDVFHGAIGPERLVVGPDGRLVITEYVLGEAVEQAITEWGTGALWRDYRLAAISDKSLTRFGRRLDLVQIGLVTLSLLVGRPLSARDFPDGLRDLIGNARETTGEGESVPAGPALTDWLTRMLYVDPSSAFRTLIEAQKAFGRMVEEEPRYGVSSIAVESFFQQCEEAALLPLAPADLEPAESDRPQNDRPLNDRPEAYPTGNVGQASRLSEGEGTPEDDAPRSSSEQPAGDPFGPWPVVVGSDTVATLFDTFKPKEPSRESHVAEIPDALQAGAAKASPAAELAPAPYSGERRIDESDPFGGLPGEAAPPADAGGSEAGGTVDWMAGAETATARQLRETLFQAEPAPEPVTAALAVPDAAAPPAVATTPAYDWATPSMSPAAMPKVDVVVVEPPTAPGPAPDAGPEPRPGGSGAVRAASERRPAVVLSYDELHKPAAASRSRGPLLAVAAFVVVVAAIGLVAGPRLWKGMGAKGGAAAESSTQASSAARSDLGGFKITTQPPGGRITIDGKPRGTAPLRVDDLAPGLHSITVESDWGSADEAATVEAGKVTPLALSTIGYIKVAAPVELRVSEEGRSYGTTGNGPVMVPAGRHHFDLVNQEVAVRLRQFVEVLPGRTVTVPVELPAGMLNLNADSPAQVLLDGQPIGETPLLSVPATLGSHEVIFRSAKYGEVSYTVNVTLAAPVRLTVTFNKR